jgi:hypothetical protein
MDHELSQAEIREHNTVQETLVLIFSEELIENRLELIEHNRIVDVLCENAQRAISSSSVVREYNVPCSVKRRKVT